MAKRVIISSYFLLVVGLLPVSAQELDSMLIKKGIMQLCPRLAYAKDSVAVKTSLDSIAMQMAGRWSLRIIESGWTAGRKPEKAVELLLDRQGKGVIYEDGQAVASIEFFIRRVWAMVRFDLKQQGQSIIRLDVSKRNGGGLHVCDEKLFISNGYADGTMYAFRRLQ